MNTPILGQETTPVEQTGAEIEIQRHRSRMEQKRKETFETLVSEYIHAYYSHQNTMFMLVDLFENKSLTQQEFDEKTTLSEAILNDSIALIKKKARLANIDPELITETANNRAQL